MAFGRGVGLYIRDPSIGALAIKGEEVKDFVGILVVCALFLFAAGFLTGMYFGGMWVIKSFNANKTNQELYGKSEQ